MSPFSSNAVLDSAEAWTGYLREAGLSDVMDVHVVSGGRHRLARAHFPGGRGLLCKQGLQRSRTGDGALLQEGLTYLLCAQSGVAEARRIMPRCVFHDRHSDVLGLELVEGPTLRDQLAVQADGLAGVMSRIAHALASVHYGTHEKLPGYQHVYGPFGELMPDASPLSRDEYAALSPGELTVMAVIQSDPDIARTLRGLRQVSAHSLIHGDLRCDNILLVAEEGMPAFAPLLIDWELARPGDPAMDLGTLYGSLLEAELLRLREELVAQSAVADPAAGSLLMSAARTIAPLLGGLLAAYENAVGAWTGRGGPGVTPRMPGRARVIAHAGAHLMHRAAAFAQVGTGLGSQGRTLLVVARAMLRAPHGALSLALPIPAGLSARGTARRSG
ncbi:aminoglycoside phosphotransferase family protein (plasmid) [Streptomyces sp. HU2014]|uniref:phosphotransferase n=1 Tax=Streptomyces sp. HU2014 TaxID=2939414 RepID=UPI00200CCBDF|nr:phosphotransferase [Streptomyces sp. HU2014]UQI49735.1 aminoglycoside phosphotransferase family protein [Streptomyces sp. HU2014]